MKFRFVPLFLCLALLLSLFPAAAEIELLSVEGGRPLAWDPAGTICLIAEDELIAGNRVSHLFLLYQDGTRQPVHFREGMMTDELAEDVFNVFFRFDFRTTAAQRQETFAQHGITAENMLAEAEKVFFMFSRPDYITVSDHYALVYSGRFPDVVIDFETGEVVILDGALHALREHYVVSCPSNRPAQIFDLDSEETREFAAPDFNGEALVFCGAVPTSSGGLVAALRQATFSRDDPLPCYIAVFEADGSLRSLFPIGCAARFGQQPQFVHFDEASGLGVAFSPSFMFVAGCVFFDVNSQSAFQLCIPDFPEDPFGDPLLCTTISLSPDSVFDAKSTYILPLGFTSRGNLLVGEADSGVFWLLDLKALTAQLLVDPEDMPVIDELRSLRVLGANLYAFSCWNGDDLFTNNILANNGQYIRLRTEESLFSLARKRK